MTICYAVEAKPYDGLDFWNDPMLWDGIGDTHRQFCWIERPPKKLIVREPEKPTQIEQVMSAQPAAYMNGLNAQNAYAGYLNQQQANYQNSLGALLGARL